uniref:Uncharacterized protein n=1 Tax=Chromera velia CCMP2878 TaxID=1169474 RepID=A0A0G4FC36_9ALVE|eukprot:Cvel_3180.t1-p1 / transcript=Cvel_3180.t1 / gene=Cvel_3180 / organism=Chromera_velia_CCMP2878 / gene_product=hypothetical protein / transcript_product=hypothetical protein / location=Cvel_scaffold124:21299-22657(-) / protein_length=453 / sequence_SO=supercontig / SO=protein_coding / is_pseudo=false
MTFDNLETLETLLRDLSTHLKSKDYSRWNDGFSVEKLNKKVSIYCLFLPAFPSAELLDNIWTAASESVKEIGNRKNMMSAEVEKRIKAVQAVGGRGTWSPAEDTAFWEFKEGEGICRYMGTEVQSLVSKSYTALRTYHAEQEEEGGGIIRHGGMTRRLFDYLKTVQDWRPPNLSGFSPLLVIDGMIELDRRQIQRENVPHVYGFSLPSHEREYAWPPTFLPTSAFRRFVQLPQLLIPQSAEDIRHHLPGAPPPAPAPPLMPPPPLAPALPPVPAPPPVPNQNRMVPIVIGRQSIKMGLLREWRRAGDWPKTIKALIKDTQRRLAGQADANSSSSSSAAAPADPPLKTEELKKKEGKGRNEEAEKPEAGEESVAGASLWHFRSGARGEESGSEGGFSVSELRFSGTSPLCGNGPGLLAGLPGTSLLAPLPPPEDAWARLGGPFGNEPEEAEDHE